jgi:hypothetical protein
MVGCRGGEWRDEWNELIDHDPTRDMQHEKAGADLCHQ